MSQVSAKAFMEVSIAKDEDTRWGGHTFSTDLGLHGCCPHVVKDLVTSSISTLHQAAKEAIHFAVDDRHRVRACWPKLGRNAGDDANNVREDNQETLLDLVGRGIVLLPWHESSNELAKVVVHDEQTLEDIQMAILETMELASDMIIMAS